MTLILASFALLMLTSCGTKKEPTTIVPLDNGTPTQNNTYTTPTTNTPASTPTQTTTTTRTVYTAPTTTKKVVRRPYASPQASSSSQNTSYEPYAGYTSDFKGFYPQIIYNNLATGQYGNIPTFNPPNYNPQPSYPTVPPSRYTLDDFMAAYNAQHQPR